MKKVLKVVLIIALATALVLGVALPVLADSDDTASQTQCKWRPGLLRGEVVGDPSEEFFTIQVGERMVEIEVNEATRYFKVNIPQKLAALYRHRMTLTQQEGREGVEMATMSSTPMRLRATNQAPSLARGLAFRSSAPVWVENQEFAPDLSLAGLGKEKPKHLQGNLKWLRQFGEEVTYDELADGDRVVVWVVPGNDRPLAKVVLILEPTAYQRVSDTIYIDDGTLTVDSEEGEIDLGYDEHTTFVLHGTPYLEDGMKAMVIYVETDDGLLAKRVMARKAD